MPGSVISKAGELAGQACFFCLANAAEPVKSPFLQLGDPAEIGLERRDVVAELVAVKRHRRFQPQSIPRRQPAGKYPVLGAVAARFEKLVPKLFGTFRCGIDLKAVLARVAGPRNDRLDAVNPALGKVVIPDRRKIGLGQLLDDAEGVRPLDGDLAKLAARVCQGHNSQQRCDAT